MPNYARPITVLVALDGRHLFDTIRDERVTVTSDPSAPNLVVFPCGQDRRFEKAAQVQLPPHVHEGIRNGSIGVVVDASTEGVLHKQDITEALHALLHRLGASRGVYVTQERNWPSEYLAHCVAGGIEPRVTVLTHDYWVWESLAPFAGTGEAVYAQRLQAFRARSACRRRRFVSLNRTPRPSKILFLLRLLHDDLWDRGYISFGGFRAQENGPGKSPPTINYLRQKLPAFEDLFDELLPLLGRLDAYGRVLLGMDRHGWTDLPLENAGRAIDLAEYDDSWFSVVTETEMRARASRITEKILKPLVNFHPLVVFGNPGSLAMVREYGFVTFEDVIDESYDTELDPRCRFERAYAEVVRLCRLEEADLRALEVCVFEKLIFNAHWGLTRFPSHYRSRRDTGLTDTILRRLRLNSSLHTEQIPRDAARARYGNRSPTFL